MKALSLQQPYATLIANGSKTVETRRWHPKKDPKVIVICSSKKPITGAQHDRLVAGEPFASCLDGEEIPNSAMLAVATIGRFVRTELIPYATFSEQEKAFGDYSLGRWAWFLGDVYPLDQWVQLEPLKKGQKEFRLGLWDLGKRDEANLAAALGRDRYRQMKEAEAA